MILTCPFPLASSLPTPTSKSSAHIPFFTPSPLQKSPWSPWSYIAIASTSASTGMSGACSQINDEAGDPAVTQTSGPVLAASCCSSSPQPPPSLAPCACQASCQRYFPNGSSACFAGCSPCLPAGCCGPPPSQAAGEGFHGYAGLESPAYRW